MYITDFEVSPSKLVIGSTRAANNLAHLWLKENDLHHVLDASGQIWHIDSNVIEKPSATDQHGTNWHVTIRLSAQFTGQELVDRCILDAKIDQRLIEILGDEIMTLAMKPMEITCTSREEARNIFISRVQSLKRKLEKTLLVDVKRKFLGRWIDRKCVFGSALNLE